MTLLRTRQHARGGKKGTVSTFDRTERLQEAMDINIAYRRRAPTQALLLRKIGLEEKEKSTLYLCRRYK